VANLTLLALGSSAPEILLSCIEMLKDEGYSGALGPSTIVGSAAFNLFVIVGVCIVAITDPADHRSIAGLAVYHVTLIFSLFAYFWLWFIVVVSSPDIVEPWEAGLALVMFPVLVFVSWLTDKGYLPFLAMDPLPSVDDGTEHRLCKHPRVRVSELHLASAHEFEAGRRKTVQKWKEAIADEAEAVDHTRWPYRDDGRGIEEEPGKLIDNEYGIIAFRSDTERTGSRLNHRHSFSIDVLRRNGTSGTVTCEWRTESFTAVPSQDFVGRKGQLEFGPGVDEQEITVEILGKRIGEPEDAFQVVLSDIKTDGVTSDNKAHFNPHDDGGREKALCTITIANENEAEPDGCFEKLGALSERWFVDRASLQMGWRHGLNRSRWPAPLTPKREMMTPKRRSPRFQVRWII
jgi:solute carrier family 8 (sodium/calcium exchanger)